MSIISSLNIPFSSSLLLIGASQALLFAFLLYWLFPQRWYFNRFLAIILASMGFTFLTHFLVFSGVSVHVKWAVGLTQPLELIYGPSLYWYIRTITQPQRDNTWGKVLPHFIPIVVGVLLNSPFFALDYQQKILIIQKAYMLSTWPSPVNYYFAAFMLLAIGLYSCYLYQSFKLLRQHRQTISEIFSYEEKISLVWLSRLLTIFVTFFGLLVIYLSLITAEQQMIKYFEALLVITFFAVLYLGMMGLKQSIIYKGSINSTQTHQSADEMESFDGLANAVNNENLVEDPLNDVVKTTTDCVKQSIIKPPKTKVAAANNDKTNKVVDKVNDDNKYQKSGLTREDMETIRNKVSEVMKTEQLYLQPGLTLPQLAKAVSTPTHYVSQTLNEALQLSFFDFINRLRIDYAKQKLEQINNQQSILTIAMSAGFNSKSAFYTAFKKQTLMTPAQYRKQNKS